MVFELHIWGSAFGLPSIEPQSLAIVAYLNQCLPPGEWRLIPSSDPSAGPTNELPALRIDSRWICGFRPIVNFVREHSSGNWDLDQALDEKQRADSIAFSSFLESRGQPLLDLSLYVCSENYTEWTRPALAQILQWPHQWVVPHKLRDEAKVRSEHLGLSSLDIETASNKDGHTNARDTGYIPKNLVTKPKETVAGMLGKSGHQNQFRLDAVTSDFFEPLWELVKKNGSHSWVFGTDQASSLDCLLLAYMSLMAPPLIPPCNWLQDALSARYPALMQWTTNFRQESFGGPVDPTKLLSMSASNHPASHRDLPWHPQASISMTNIGLTVLKATFDSLPIISRYRSDRIIQASPRDMGTDTTESSAMVQTTKYPRYSGLGVTVGALGASMAYCFYMGFFGPQGSVHQTDVIRRRRNMTDQRDFGEAGKMLGLGVM